MVTVIEENKDEILDCGKYAEMNLAEACHQFEIDTIQTINEFEMGVLLSEHAYLMENGHEIEYVGEAGGINLASVKEKVVGFLGKIGEFIKNLFNKAIEWITDRANEVIAFFQSKSITKAHVAKAKELIGSRTVKVTISKYVDNNKLLSAVNGDQVFKKNANDSSVDLDSFVEADKEINVGATEFDSAYDSIWNFREDLKKVKEARGNANKAIKELIKQAKSMDGDNVGSDISDLKEAAKDNSKAASEVCKLLHYGFNASVTIVRAILREDDIRKAIKDADVAKTKENVAKAANNVGKAAGTVAGAVEKGAKATGEGVKKGAEAVAGAAKKGAEAVGNAAKTTGKAVADAGKAVGGAAKNTATKLFKTGKKAEA